MAASPAIALAREMERMARWACSSPRCPSTSFVLGLNESTSSICPTPAVKRLIVPGKALVNCSMPLRLRALSILYWPLKPRLYSEQYQSVLCILAALKRRLLIGSLLHCCHLYSSASSAAFSALYSCLSSCTLTPLYLLAPPSQRGRMHQCPDTAYNPSEVGRG